MKQKPTCLKNYHFSNGKRKQQNWLLKIIQLDLQRCRRTFLDKKRFLKVKGGLLYFLRAMQEHSAFFLFCLLGINLEPPSLLCFPLVLLQEKR